MIKTIFSEILLFSDGPASAAFFASYELIQRWLQGPERLVFVKLNFNQCYYKPTGLLH